MTRFLARIALAALVLAAPVPHSAAMETTTRPIVLGYYPGWPTGVEPSQVDLRPFTHIAHAFVTVDTSGTLVTHGNVPSRELTSRARAAGVRTLLSLGGMDSAATIAPVAADEARCRALARDLVALAQEHGYDGLDLDWEFPLNEGDMEAFTRLCRMTREEMNARGMTDGILTSAQGGSRWTSRFVDGPALLPLLDFICVMTYDAHGHWNDHSGHNAPLHHADRDRPECAQNTVEGMMEHWTTNKGWPRERLVVGIPCYGRGFPVAAMHDDKTTGSKGRHEYLPFHRVPAMLEEGWRIERDAQAGVPVLVRDGVREVVSIEDETSAREKAAWARRQGFAGVFFWEITQDVVDGRNRLVGAAREGWFGASADDDAPTTRPAPAD
jgi:chitinase